MQISDTEEARVLLWLDANTGTYIYPHVKAHSDTNKVNRSVLDILQTADDHECSNIVKTRRERSSTNVLIGLELV